MSSQMSPRKRAMVYAKTNGACAYCGSDLDATGFVIDHVHPKAFGGRNDDSNLLPACSSCNTSKGKKSLDQFRLFCGVKKVTGATVFSQAQIEYLHTAGAFPVLGFDADHRFPFEMIGER